MKNCLLLFFLLFILNISFSQNLVVTPININKGILLERGYIDDNDRIVVGTEQGIFLFDDSIEIQQISPIISRVYPGRHNNIIFCNDSLDIYSWQQGIITTYTFDSLHSGIDPGSNSNNLYNATQLSDDRIMIIYGSDPYNLVRFLDINSSITVQSHPNLLGGYVFINYPNFNKIGSNKYLFRQSGAFFVNTIYDETLDQFTYVADSTLSSGSCQFGIQVVHSNYPANNSYYSRTAEGIFLMNESTIIKEQCFVDYGFSVPFSDGIGATHPISNDFFVADKDQLLRSNGDTIIRYGNGQGYNLSFASNSVFLNMDFSSNGDMYIFHRTEGIFKINTSILSKIEEDISSNDHKLFPNPAGNRVYLQLNQKVSSKGSIKIFNLSGQEELIQYFETENGISSIDFNSKIVSGFYFYNIEMENDKIYKGKILIN